MPHARNKTQPTTQPVSEFLATLADEQQRLDCEALCRMMTEITGEPATMWGTNMIGFGRYHYKYESGREGDAAPIGFAPRKGSLTVYLADGFARYGELLGKLGKFKTGKVCLYLKKLSDIDSSVLREMLRQSHAYIMDRKNNMHRAE